MRVVIAKIRFDRDWGVFAQGLRQKQDKTEEKKRMVGAILILLSFPV